MKSLQYLSVFVRAVTDDETLANGERMVGGFVRIIQSYDAFLYTGGSNVDEQTIELVNSWQHLSEWYAARNDDAIRLLTDRDAERLYFHLRKHSPLTEIQQQY